MICRIRVGSVFVTFRFRCITLIRNLLGNENPKNNPSSSTSNSEARTDGEEGSAIPAGDTIIIQVKQAVLSILIKWKSLWENEVRKAKGVGVMSRVSIIS